MLGTIWKQKRNRILLFAELVVLLILLALWVFKKNDVITLSAQQYELTGGIYDAASYSCIADPAAGSLDPFATMGPLELKPGLYRVVCNYNADTAGDSLIRVVDDQAPYRGLLTNGATLYSGVSATSFQMWVFYHASDLKVQVVYSGNGPLLLGDLSLVETSGLERAWFLVALCLFLLFDLVYFGLLREKLPVLGVLVITFLASLPLTGDVLISGGDLIYHLMRIEGIKDGLLAGQFPVRIAPRWLFGYGYASSVFYGEILLYLPAVLRLMGFTVQGAYKVLLFLLNLGTAGIACYAFSRISGDRKTGLVAALLYTLAPPRLFDTYVYAAVGRVGAYLFLPFIALGFYLLFTEDTGKESGQSSGYIGYARHGIWLVIGFSGLIQTHSLSGMLAVFFSILLCLILAPLSLRKRTLGTIAGAAGITLLLNAWFILPFLDFLRRGDFVLEHTQTRTIQSEGLSLSQLAGLFLHRASDYAGDYHDLFNSGQPSLGLPLFLVLVVFAALALCRNDHALGAKPDTGKRVVVPILSVFSMYMCLYLFPWDAIQSFCLHHALLKGIASFIANLQFPKRILMITVLLLTVQFCLNAGRIRRLFPAGAGKAYLVAFTALGLICASYLTEDILYSSPYVYLYNEEGMGYGYVSGGEYLPVGADLSGLTFKGAESGSGELTVSEYGKEGLRVWFSGENTGEDSYVDVPLLAYPHYEARTDRGEKLALSMGEYGQVRVQIPAGFNGAVQVSFHTPWYWYGADLVSLLVLAGLAAAFGGGFPLWKRKRNKRMTEDGR